MNLFCLHIKFQRFIPHRYNRLQKLFVRSPRCYCQFYKNITFTKVTYLSKFYCLTSSINVEIAPPPHKFARRLGFIQIGSLVKRFKQRNMPTYTNDGDLIRLLSFLKKEKAGQKRPTYEFAYP